MNPRTLCHRLGGVADRIAVFDDILALGDIDQRKLMAATNILQEGNLLTVNLNYLALLQVVGNGYGHVIYGIDFQKSFHCQSSCIKIRAGGTCGRSARIG